ncbi:LIPOPROTEIN VSAH (FRAGMENT), partial [Mycoplasmopsis pulmonis]
GGSGSGSTNNPMTPPPADTPAPGGSGKTETPPADTPAPGARR